MPLSERVKRYDGDVSIRPLDVQQTPEMLETLSQFRQEMKGRPYEEDEIELIKAAYDGPLGRNTEDLRSLFCSELVAEAYQRMGLLSDAQPANEYTPKDFSDEGELVLLKGKLGKEIRLVAG